MYKALSKWRASTGKYDVIVYRDEGSQYDHEIREATELRAFINDHYDLGAVEVEVRDFNRNAIILKRVYGASDI
jgi:hypothetical protein